jgi:hypothetical protein
MFLGPCDTSRCHSFAHTVGTKTAMMSGIFLFILWIFVRGGIAITEKYPVNLKESDPIFLFTVSRLFQAIS